MTRSTSVAWRFLRNGVDFVCTDSGCFAPGGSPAEGTIKLLQRAVRRAVYAADYQGEVSVNDDGIVGKDTTYAVLLLWDPDRYPPPPEVRAALGREIRWDVLTAWAWKLSVYFDDVADRIAAVRIMNIGPRVTERVAPPQRRGWLVVAAAAAPVALIAGGLTLASVLR